MIDGPTGLADTGSPLDSIPLDAGVPDDAPVIADRYVLVDRIGTGGMGDVWSAFQISPRRIVAIKFLREAVRIERFEQEVRALGRLHHPGIVSIIEAGSDAGRPFLVLEHVPGQTLEELAAAGPVDPRTAAEWIAEAAEAIAFAHEHKILHRDVTPSNLIRDGSNRVRVMDFGLAKDLAHSLNVTADGAILGTPSYMAPEQIDLGHGKTDERTDVFGLGGTLYRLLVGFPAFQAPNAQAVFRRVLEEEPVAPRSVDPTIPLDLQNICLKAIRKDARSRYASAAHFAEELRAFLAGRPVSARPLGMADRAVYWCRRNRALAVLTAVLLISILGGTVIAFSQWRRAELARQSVTVIAEQNRRTLVGQWVERGMEEADRGDALRGLPWILAAWRSDLDAGATHRIGIHQRQIAGLLDLAPRILQLRRYELPLATVAVQDPQHFAVGTEGGQIDFIDLSQGGFLTHQIDLKDWILMMRYRPHHQEIAVATLRSNARSQLVMLGEAGAELGRFDLPDQCSGVDFTPDGQIVAAASWDGSIVLISPDTKSASNTGMRHSKRTSGLRFDGSGETLVSIGWDGRIVGWDWRTGQARWEIQTGEYVRQLATSPDGKLCAAAGDDGFVRMLEMQSGRVLAKLPHPKWALAVAFSPDGQRLATADAGGSVRIWGVREAAWISSPFGHRNNILSLRFSPDGRRLAVSGRDRLAHIWDLNTFQPLGSALNHLSEVQDSIWLGPDRLATLSRDHCFRIWRLPDAESRRIRTIHTVTCALSPDERWLALGGGDETLASLFDIANPAQPPTPFGASNSIAAATFHPTLPELVTQSTDRYLRIWSSTNPLVGLATLTNSEPISAIAASSDGRHLVARGATGVTIWDWPARRLKARHALKTRVGPMIFCAGGSRIALADNMPGVSRTYAPGNLTVLDLDEESAAPVVISLKHQAQVVSATPEGWIIAGDASGQVQVFNPTNGQPVLPPFRHNSDLVLTLSIDPRGRSVVVGGADGNPNLRDLRTGSLIRTLGQMHGPVLSSYDPSGRFFFALGRDGGSRLWETEQWEPLLPDIKLDTMARRVFIGARSQRLVVSCQDGTLWLGKIPQPGIDFRKANDLSIVHTGSRVDPQGRLISASPDEILAAWDRLRATEGP